MKSLITTVWLLTVLLLPHHGAQAQAPAQNTPAAVVVAVDGTVFVTRETGRATLLARGSSLQVGDAINTSRNSSVRLKFSDGGETVVRPESTLLVQNYQFQPGTPGNDSLLLRLFKGGMRALTGSIGKRGNADAYQLRASTATVGIRGTDYSVRLCQKDCKEEQDSSLRNSATPVAARAVQVRGVARVSRNGAAMVALLEGAPLYSGDVLQTLVASHVVLVFSDGTRITVNPASQMGISEYLNDKRPGSTASGSMIIDMFKGGLRFATGLIGKSNPEKVKVLTATSTIGIRGTAFDLVCAPSSSADSASTADVGDMPCEESLFAQTREGIVALSGGQGDPLLISAGQSGRVNGPNAPARAIDTAPGYFRNLSAPIPETVPANLEALFGAQISETSDGVLLTVHKGQVVLTQADQAILLDAGESAFAGSAAVPVRLQSVPPVLDRDPFLSGGMFSANMCRR